MRFEGTHFQNNGLKAIEAAETTLSHHIRHRINQNNALKHCSNRRDTHSASFSSQSQHSWANHQVQLSSWEKVTGNAVEPMMQQRKEVNHRYGHASEQEENKMLHGLPIGQCGNKWRMKRDEKVLREITRTRKTSYLWPILKRLGCCGDLCYVRKPIQCCRRPGMSEQGDSPWLVYTLQLVPQFLSSRAVAAVIPSVNRALVAVFFCMDFARLLGFWNLTRSKPWFQLAAAEFNN